MVLRRIREHITHHNWFAVAIDFAIVVSGVFVGIQASNWNQARLDREKGRNYRSRLIEELRSTEQTMRVLKDYSDVARRHGISALAVLRNPQLRAGEAFLVDAYQASQVVPRSSHHATYDEIISSGNLELVGSPALRERISNYYWRMDGVMSLDGGSTGYRERLRSIMPYEVQAAIRAKCDEILSYTASGLVLPRLPGNCLPGIEPRSAEQAATRIRNDPALVDDLTRALSTYDSRELSFAKLEANARELRLAMVHS